MHVCIYIHSVCHLLLFVLVVITDLMVWSCVNTLLDRMAPIGIRWPYQLVHILRNTFDILRVYSTVLCTYCAIHGRY